MQFNSAVVAIVGESQRRNTERMEKGKGVMGSLGRRWNVDFTDNSTCRDIPDPPGFSRASLDQVRSEVSFSQPFHSNLALLFSNFLLKIKKKTKN